MARYGFAIFLGAFLLFQVQPVIGKFILPWFGGTSSVWTTCLLFFQVMLLIGYAYAHLMSKTFKSVRGWLHLALLVASLAVLPIMPDAAAWRPDPDTAPTVQVLLLLTVSVGFPYLVLASTGPLLQRWFSLSHPGASPYRFYALSNFASLLALLSYPLVIEPFVTRKLQAITWSWSYAAFVVAAGFCAWKMSKVDVGPAEYRLSAHAPPKAIPLSRIFFWLALTASASAMLLATTNQLTLDVAAVPFLWVLPLSIYLLSFIICFDNERWYNRPFFGLLLIGIVPFACLALDKDVDMEMPVQILIYSVALFACCMTCHGELVRSKPNVQDLTLFYLVVAAGGALGGAFVALLAPVIFKGFWEFHIALASCCFVTLFAWDRALRRKFAFGAAPIPLVPQLALLAVALGFTGLVYFLSMQVRSYNTDVIAQSRNFYGVARVLEYNTWGRGWRRVLMHGNIRHGTQYMEKHRRAMPIDYYSAKSGVALAMQYHPKRKEGPLHVGVIGLGTGTLAIFGEKGDYFQFFELDPQIERMAREHFTYLQDSKARIEVTLGDGRRQVERALEEGKAGTFDIIALDAFSSDSLPIHLFTVEAVQLYWKLLKPDGLLVVHITNRFLDLRKVMVGVARETDAQMGLFSNKGSKYVSPTKWAVFARNNAAFFEQKEIDDEVWTWDGAPDAGVVWTDEYASLLHVLR